MGENLETQHTPQQLKKIEAYKRKQARALKKKAFIDKHFYYDVTLDLSEMLMVAASVLLEKRNLLL